LSLPPCDEDASSLLPHSLADFSFIKFTRVSRPNFIKPLYLI
jgi:hypothetical protein